MFKIIKTLIPIIISWVIFALVILQVPYPQSLTQAKLFQILSFFIPIFLALTLTINLFLKNIFSAGSISLGLIFLLILKALDSLNIITILLVVVATGLFVSYFRKNKRGNLTKLPKIPKLTSLSRRKPS